MRTKVTLVLLFLNVALFFFIFKFERSWRTERASLEARRRVLGAETADIRTLKVTSSAAGGSFSLTKRSEGWFLTEPLDWPANPPTVSAILTELQLLEHDAFWTVASMKNNGMTLADYGLDKPRLTLAFTSGDGVGSGGTPRTTTILLGQTTPDGNRLYLLSTDGERIHVVPRTLADSLSTPLDQIRTSTVLTIQPFEARALRLQSAGSNNPRVVLNREGALWNFSAPIVARASKDITETTLSALIALHTQTFIISNLPANLPSAAPSLRITIEGNNRRETLLLGEPIPVDPAKAKTLAATKNSGTPPATDYYAQLESRPTVLFTISVPDTLRTRLLTAQDELRETRLLDLDLRSVTAINLAAPNQPSVTLQRDLVANSAEAAPWQVLQRSENSQPPQTLPADRAAVQRILEQLSLLRAEKFVGDAPSAADLENWGFNRPEREITLRFANAASSPQSPGRGTPALTTSELTLQIGLATQRDKFAYVRVGGAPSIYAVSPDILRETPVTVRAWRERLVRELPAGARITSLKLTDLSNNTVLVDSVLPAATKPDTPAATETPPPKPLVAAAVIDLAAALRVLHAKNFPQDGFSEKIVSGGEERPWRYRLDAVVALPGGAAGEQTVTQTLMLSERYGGTQQFAGSAELNVAFELEQPLIDALWAVTYGARDPGPVIKP